MEDINGVDDKEHTTAPPLIDVDRLIRDHNLTPELLERIRTTIEWPEVFVVPSGTELKPRLLEEVLALLAPPGKKIPVVKVRVPSGVSEQPVGAETLRGADNRMKGAAEKIETGNTGDPKTDEVLKGKKTGYIGSIENGIFKTEQGPDGLRLSMSEEYDPDSSYYDAAVVIIVLPDQKITTQISSLHEAVEFPIQDVAEAHRRGFSTTTVGRVLQERVAKETGEMIDHQDPHTYLTRLEVEQKKRTEVFSRYQQLAGVLVDGFAELARTADPNNRAGSSVI